jgi:predicted PurR-regulated permease PerM
MTQFAELKRGTPDAVARALKIIAIIAVAGILLWLLSDVLLIIFLSVLIAAGLRGTADALSRTTHISRGFSLAIVALLVAALLIGFLYWIGPQLAAQAQDLWNRMIHQLDSLRQNYGNTPWGKALFQHLTPSQQTESQIASSVTAVASITIGTVTMTFLVIVTSLYLAIAPELYREGIVHLFPLSRRTRARQVLDEIGSTLRWWLLGQLIDMIVVGVLTWVGLTILGVPLPVALGVLAGLFTFVPYFGAIVAAVPATLVALTIGWQTALWTIVVFLFCHSVEGYIVAPLVQRRTVDLPPALTIMSMTILGTLFGALGVVLGTPIAAAALVAVREAYVRDALGDPSA